MSGPRSRAATFALVLGLALAAIVVFGGGACGGRAAQPSPTLPPPIVNIGPPSAASGPQGYEITPTSAPVGGPPSGGAAATAKDAGTAPPAQDAAPAPKATTPSTPPPGTAPLEDPKQPGGLPPTPSVMQNDGGPAAAPIIGDAGVPKLPTQPLGK